MEGGGSELLPTIQIEEEDNINGEERGGGGGRGNDNDEEFYEHIEAPKFFDFTLPLDNFCPDDRYWFCSRLGCDRKHEEEIDPEEISKNFVLRVMATRSPNIKLRRALNARSNGMNMKCPLSAPAKSSKPRITRLAMISHKLVDPNPKVGPPSKLSSTPIAKSKQVAAKYMTTPRRKKSLPTSNPFRTVQNPKPTSVLPKNQLVAKALVFNSPKKGISEESSVELHSYPITKICEGMKRVDNESQMKRVLGYSSKSSKDIKSSSKKPFTKDNSGRRLSFIRGRRVSFLKGKKGSKESLPPQNSNDREAKSSRGITEKSSFVDANKLEEPALIETSHSLLADDSRAEMKSLQNAEEKDVEEEDGKTKAISESVGSRPKNDSNGYQLLQDWEQEMGRKDNDDKENVLTSDVIRDNNCDNQQSRKKVLGSQETLKTKKVARVVDKNLKDVGPIIVKYKKPTVTHPKPFRLRTDERGILKEANLDRKLHFPPAPQNESAKDSGCSGGNSKRITHRKASEGNYQTDEQVSRATQREPKSLTSPLSNGKAKVTPKSENGLMRIKSPHLKQQQVLTPQGAISTEKVIASYMRPGKQLGVITETPKGTKPTKENVDGTMLIPKTGSAPSASRSISGSKRPITIPKEPNFHTLHVPKSCTRNVA